MQDPIFDEIHPVFIQEPYDPKKVFGISYWIIKPKESNMRKFDTGATRDSEEGKLDFDGFLSPCALERYARYMHKHRKQADGKMRDSDNWQKGMPADVYMKSMFRHFFDVWAVHRGHLRNDDKAGELLGMQECLCALLFNVMGYLHILTDMRPKIEENPVKQTPQEVLENCKKSH